jgi:hypothetical protein
VIGTAKPIRRRFARMNADQDFHRGDAEARKRAKSLKHGGKEEAEGKKSPPSRVIAEIARDRNGKTYSPQICADETQIRIFTAETRRRGESLRIDWLLVPGCSSVFLSVLCGEWFWVSISAIFGNFGNTGNLLTIASPCYNEQFSSL